MQKYFLSKVVFTLVVLLLLASSCANHKLHNNSTVNKKEVQEENPSGPLTHSMFLVGNTGAEGEGRKSVLKLLESHLSKSSENSTVLFLGDQVGENGMPSKSKSSKRKESEERLDAQLAILENYKGRPVFLPGNKDWGAQGLKGLSRQEEYIEEALNKGIKEEDDWGNYFLPDGGCPGPEVVEINDDLVVIIIDSEWWLTNWDEQPNISEGCDIKSRAAFELAVLDEIKDHKKKNIVFASHHALKSVGQHAGYFTFKDHLFPLRTVTEKSYVPLPIIGSVFLLLRKAGILKEDLNNRHYDELSDVAVKPAESNGEFIFAASSESSLQYIQTKGQHFVIAGGGAKPTGTKARSKAEFSYGENGFSKIDFYEDGSAWVEFWVPAKDGEAGKMVYRTKMKDAFPKDRMEELAVDFSVYNSKIDSVFTTPSTRDVKKLGGFGDFMLGERRRSIYMEKYNFPTLDLATYKGGLKVIKRGGGKQTNSLRLSAPDGKEYVMRSLTKDANRGVPYPLNKLKFVNYLFSETFLGSHCFAPLTLSVLADAAKVYHTNPGLYFVPKQPVLGIHNDMFGGEVYLVEERPSESWPEADNFGNAEKFVSTPKLNRKLEKSHKHKVDQRWLLRSRLFDMLIGDIDRHGDQWRWTVQKMEDGSKLYRPIPRDRDNAFASFDGFAFKILRPYHPIVRQLNDYEEEVGNPKWSYYNARHFDHNFLNEMTLEDWIEEAKYIQEHVTDEEIEKAMSLFPEKVIALTADQITNTLKNRRAALQGIATIFYSQLAKKTVVKGTDKKDLFEVIRIDDEHTSITVYDTNGDGDKQAEYYRRVFKTSETREVYLYGLENDDIFRISGEVDKSIRLYIVGGAGEDQFVNTSIVRGLGKKDVFYDTKKGNELNLGSEGKNRTSNINRDNVYDPLGNQYDEGNLIGLPTMGYNISDGFTAGVFLFYKVNRFNKHPFAQDHRFRLNYAFATNGLDINYGIVFNESIKRSDLVLNLELHNKGYSFNYFGIGNDIESDANNVNNNRVLQNQFYLDFGWQRRFANESGAFSIRPVVNYRKIENENDDFVGEPDNGLTPEDFEARWYGGVVSELKFNNTDNDIHPRDGFRFNNRFTWQKNVTGSERNFRKAGSNFTFYKSFGARRLLILATKIGAEMIRGSYDFYNAPTLGQDENIRGLFGQRYRAETSFYHITDLRIAVASIKRSPIPFSMGVTGSFDYGRVFQRDVNSDTWHASAGGGLFFAPLNAIIISVNYNKIIADKGGTIVMKMGHSF